MGTLLDDLKKSIDVETKKMAKTLKAHSFRIVCNTLINSLDKGKEYYRAKEYERAYIYYMVTVNIYFDELNEKKFKDFNSKLSEYSILKNELNNSIDTITEIKTEIQNKEKFYESQKSTLNVSLSRDSSNELINSPKVLKTITPKKVFYYISRIEGREENAPQILLIDIRERNVYDAGHITWTNNSKRNFNGVINIPLSFFYGVNKDINNVLSQAENNESNAIKKNLIRNISESDLVIYYDDTSMSINNQIHQIISDLLYHNSKKIKKPPIMLESGYKGWLQFLKNEKLNSSIYTESSVGLNNLRNIGSHQNISEINKDKVNNFSSDSYSNDYYTKYANINTEFTTTPSQSSFQMPSAPMSSYAASYATAPTPTNDLYSTINVNPSAPLSNTQTTAYPNLDDDLSNIPMPQPNSTTQPAVPQKPYTLKYQLPSSSQNQYSNYVSGTSYFPSPPSTQSYASTMNYSSMPMPPSSSFYPQQNINIPSYSSTTTTSFSNPNPSGTPPEIPERHNSIKPTTASQNKLSSATSYDSLSTYSTLQPPNLLPRNQKNIGVGNPPPVPAKEFSLNEIHNKSHGTVGLRNLGNTCYMNSILQCLNATSLLTQFFLRGRYKNDINYENTLGTKGDLATAYYNFLRIVWNEHLPVVSPNSIKDVISNFNSEFKGSEQHDSQEFLSCILDGLHEDLNVARRKSKSEIERIRARHDAEQKMEERDEPPLEKLQDNAWKRYMDFNYSIIVTTFQGQYMSTLKCSRCNKSSSTFNSLMYLSVPIPKNATNLYDCLDKYIEVEHLSGNDAWSCPNCKMKVNASKQLILSRLPEIMLIHLKRFYYQGPFKDKITKSIKFPLTNLDLSKYTHPFRINENKYKYNLFAISNHYGTLSGGHYTAFVKDKMNNNWVSFDDSRISDISESKIMTNAAYILFYERVK